MAEEKNIKDKDIDDGRIDIEDASEAKAEYSASGDEADTCGNAETAAEPEESEKKADDADSGEAEKRSEKKKDEKDLKIEELTDKWKRLMAEFENFRKRTEAEKSGMYAEGERTVLEKILPVVDNFERALAAVPEELKGNAYVDGMEKIYRQFTETLKVLGVEPIEAEGKEFDSNLHNAVMHIEDEGLGDNIVAEELQKGYMFNGKVLRYSMVKVAN